MVYRLPPLPALRALEAAARHLSFKQAAEELCVTPAAISQQIKVLEEYLGKPLFERLPRSIRLLPAGEAMLPKVREGFECLAAAVEATRAQQTETLNVNAPPGFASRWLMPRLTRFTERYPEIDLRLSGSADNIDNPDTLATHNVDPRTDVSEISIRYGNGDYPGHRVSQIFNPVLVVACSPRLLKGEHPLRTPEDLRWHVLIHDDTVPDQSEHTPWVDWMRAAGVEDIETRKGPRFSNTLAMEAAIDGLGVMLVSRPLIADAVEKGHLVVPFETTIPSRHGYYLVIAEALAERPAVLAFSNWLLQEAVPYR